MMHIAYFGRAAVVGVALVAYVVASRAVSNHQKANVRSQNETKGNSVREVSRNPGVKNWFKYQNKRGKFIWLRDAWRYLRGLYHFHPRQRFLNLWIGRIGTFLGIWKPISLPSWIIQRRYHVFVQAGANGKRVKKLARGDNQFSFDLIKELEQSASRTRFKEVLGSAKTDRWLRSHCVTATEIRVDGGYSSEYVEGINLAQLRDELFIREGVPVNVRYGLLHAIPRLIEDLNGYCQEHGHLVGDWALQNLIYSTASQTIVNVDAEGFFTYGDGVGEASLKFVETNLRNLAELLKLIDSPSLVHAKIVDIFRVMDQVRRSGEQYSGSSFVAGYHSLQLNGLEFRGQRECTERLAQVPFDFRGKVVLDLGCNIGGMLHPISGDIRRGYGFDSNPDCINTAGLIKSLNHSLNLEFYTVDLDREDFSLLKCFFLQEKIDICFLLSMCRWLDRWETVVRQASRLSETMLFESNGTAKEQGTQSTLLRELYGNVALLSETSDDDFSLGNRKLYLCTQRRSAG